MIHVEGHEIKPVGDTKMALAECSVAVGALIYAQSKADGKPFEETAERMITHITNAILYAHRMQENEKN